MLSKTPTLVEIFSLGFFASPINVMYVPLLDTRGLRMTQNAHFSLLTHTKQLLILIFCDTIARIGPSFQTHRFTDRRMDRQRWRLKYEVI